jgi:hypothetical protein
MAIPIRLWSRVKSWPAPTWWKKTRAPFAETYGFERTFTDYKEMLREMQLDVVSVCTWMHLHEPMVLAALRSRCESNSL